MQQFFIEDLKKIELSKDQKHQCKHVMRMRSGECVRLVDQKGEGGIFRFLDDDFSVFEKLEGLDFSRPKHHLTLVASLIRSEKLEWMIQKATELGVHRIILVTSDHGVVKDFGKREDRKLERLQTIAKEAAEQSYRQFVPVIEGIYKIKDIASQLVGKIYYADTKNYGHFYSLLDDEKNINVLIGPEGGFSERERQFFVDSNFIPVSLGRTILRAETASIFVCSTVSIWEAQNAQNIK